jgi:FtsZ-interacting cell division protein ZipA
VTDVLVVVLAVAVVALLVVVLLQSRSRAATPVFDESKLKDLLDQALADRQRPAGRHADDQTGSDDRTGADAGPLAAAQAPPSNRPPGMLAGNGLPETGRPQQRPSGPDQPTAGPLVPNASTEQLHRELARARAEIESTTAALRSARAAEKAVGTAKAEGRREAEQALAGAKAAVERERAGLADEKTRLVADAASVLAAGPEAARRRLLGLLARRGYSSSLSTRVVEDAIAGHGQSS